MLSLQREFAIALVAGCVTSCSLQAYGTGTSGSQQDASLTAEGGLDSTVAEEASTLPGEDGPGGEEALGEDVEQECSPGFKRCSDSGDCVAEDVAHGCANKDCSPCAFAHASVECKQGVCAPVSCDEGWADCNKQVEDGCEIEIASEQDHCGDCSVRCPPDAWCEHAKCVCPGGDSPCGSACIDTDKDPANCGTCGNACESLESCEEGSCECKKDDCSGKCVDLSRDTDNCGYCGNQCNCHGCGSCCCNGDCNESTCWDDNNCGGCGNVCKNGETCSAGTGHCNQE